MGAQVEAMHARSPGTWRAAGARGIRAEGVPIGRKRVARLMRAAGLQRVRRRKWVTTTQPDPAEQPAPDLVERAFVAPGQNRLWVADITYIPTWARFLYLAVVLDVWIRRVVGWGMATHLRTEPVLEASTMACQQRQPAAAVIHHSEHGCQHTSRVRTTVPGGGRPPIDGLR